MKKAQLLESTRILDQLKVEFNRNDTNDGDEDREGYNTAANGPYHANGFHGFYGSHNVNGLYLSQAVFKVWLRIGAKGFSDLELR